MLFAFFAAMAETEREAEHEKQEAYPEAVTQAHADFADLQDTDDTPRPRNNVLVNPQGVIIGEQKDFTQNNTAGIDPSAFVQLAGHVGQVSGTLNMSEPDRVELERVAQELHAEANSENPEPGRLRQFTTQCCDRIGSPGRRSWRLDVR